MITIQEEKTGRQTKVDEGNDNARQCSRGKAVSFFLVKKKDGWAKASNKSETAKCIYTIQSLQNGSITKSKILVGKRRLYVPDRSKNFILLCPFRKKLRRYVRFWWSENL